MKPTVRLFLCPITTASLILASSSASSQWLDAPEPDVPLTTDGRVDLEAEPPRLPNGQIDLQGVWMSNDNSYIRDLALDVKDENVPYLPWARQLFDARKDGSRSGQDPDAHCLPQGVPKIDFVSYPWKLIETPSSVVIIYETFTYWRQIFTDGRRPDPNAKPAWMGYSTGRWEGDTFVVETTGFNGKVWLDQLGRPSTDQLRVTERYTRTHFGHMTIEVTIDDPGAYTEPWSATETVHLRPGWEPLEFICGENNRDVEDLPASGAVVTNIEAYDAEFGRSAETDDRR